MLREASDYLAVSRSAHLRSPSDQERAEQDAWDRLMGAVGMAVEPKEDDADIVGQARAAGVKLETVPCGWCWGQRRIVKSAPNGEGQVAMTCPSCIGVGEVVRPVATRRPESDESGHPAK